MIRLNPNPEPKKIDLGYGIVLTCVALTSALWAAARSDKAIPPIDDENTTEVVSVHLVKAVARRVIIAWDGPGDAEGNPVDPTPEWIDLLFDIDQIYMRFNARYMADFMHLREEGNASASLQTGISKEATNTAMAAESNAKIAPSSSTSRKPSKAPRSGT